MKRAQTVSEAPQENVLRVETIAKPNFGRQAKVSNVKPEKGKDKDFE